MPNAFSFKQMSIITGSLLGDGHLTKPRSLKANSYFEKPQKGSRRSYLEWHYQALQPFSSRLNDCANTCEGKKYPRSTFATKALPIFTDLRNKWYPNSKKIVPLDLVLTPLSIAIWFFDDGSNHVKKRQCRFATNSFSIEECEFLCEQLEQHQISCSLSGNQIQVHTSSYKTLIEMVSPYMLWDCFEYKVDYRDSQLKFTTSEEANEMQTLYESGMKQTQIAEKMGKSVSCISNVLRGGRQVSVGSKSGLSLSNTSGVKGVSWDKSRDKWKAYTKVSGKTKNLGRYSTKEEAEEILRVFNTI